MGVFRQSTSRADDPQLHTHVVISAKVQTVDGRWYALDALTLKKYQQAFGYLYQSVLRAEVTARFGVVFDPIVNGQAEIAGVPTELLDQFSKRAREIDTEMGDKLADFLDREGRDPSGFEYAAMEREAAVDTRRRRPGSVCRICGHAGNAKPPASASTPPRSPLRSPMRRDSTRWRCRRWMCRRWSSRWRRGSRRGIGWTCCAPSATP